MNSRTSATLPAVDPQEVYNAIVGAASQDPSRIKAATDRLQELYENYFGTYNTLHEIASQPSVDLLVRQQCIIQFKNKALPYWRSRKYLNDDQRSHMRNRCLTLLREPDELIGSNNMLIMAKIARADFPNSWPVLIPDIMSTVGVGLETWHATPSMDPNAFLLLRRSLKVLNLIIKEFISMKMLTGVKTTGQLAISLHQPLQDHYARLVSWISTINPAGMAETRVSQGILLAHLVLKSLIKIAIWVFARTESPKSEYDSLKPWATSFFQSAAAQLYVLADLRINLMLAMRSSTWSSTTKESVDYLTRHVRLLGKYFRRLQQTNVRRFVALPTCADLMLFYWSKVVQAASGPQDLVADSLEAVYPVRFLVQGLSLFQNSLAQWTPIRRDGSANEHVLAREFVEEAVGLLLTQYIPLKPSDLEGWMEDPEEWINSEEKENTQWEFELRPCAERVLMTFANQYSEFVVPLLVTMFKQVMAQPAADLSSILRREALYCAVGRCALRLREEIPFEQLLASTLVPEIRSENPSYPIIKRRIAWMIGKWVSDECAQATPLVWEVLAQLLSDRGPGSDAVVRLTAATVIRECADTISFKAETIVPFLPAVVGELVHLLTEVDSLETKRHVLASLNTIIEQTKTQILPLVQIVVEQIPSLWMGAGEDWLFRGLLLVTVSKLVEATGNQSGGLSTLVVPLVQESLAPGNAKYLDEDALILWMSALHQAPTPSNGQTPLLELFPLAILLLRNNLDLLGTITSVLEGYYLLGTGLHIQPYVVDLLSAYKETLSSATTNLSDMLTSLALFVRLAPSSVWGEAMHVSGLFPYMLQVLLDDKLSTIDLTAYVTLFARIAATDRVVFIELMNAAIASKPSNLPDPHNATWEGLMDQWWNRFDNMSEPRYRKLTAMAMANLVSTGQPVVLQRLPSEIFNLWLDVFGELKEAQSLDEDKEESPIKLYWEQDKAPHSHFGQAPEDSAEHSRRQAVWDTDPVRTVQLTAYVAGALQEAEKVVGGPQALESIISRGDPLVTNQIRAELGR